MKKILTFFSVVFMIMAFVPFAASGNGEKVRIFLEFKGAPDKDLVKANGGDVLFTYKLVPNVVAAELPEAALNGILKNPNVIGYELDTKVNINAKPLPKEVLPWGVNRIDAELSAYKGTGVVVCVVDTGVDKDHPDLMANIVGGRNFVASGGVVDPNAWDDDNSHGTHVSGTIAAIDNTIGVIGVAPGAKIRAAKVLNSTGSGYWSAVAAGIDYCVASGAKIISMSLGGGYSSVVETAVNNAYNSGSLLIASAGNSGSAVGYPAAFTNVIAVSATDSSDKIASWSNFGPKIELSAPGVSIYSTVKDGKYASYSGTSMAAPHVSGTAAIAWQKYPGYTNSQIRSVLRLTADDLGAAGIDQYYGYGLVDAQLLG